MRSDRVDGRRSVPSGRAAGSRRELAAVLASGLAGAGLALLAARQGWASIASPAGVPQAARPVTVTGQQLFPAVGALALAAAACLAAVLATSGLLRRIAGCILAALGAAAGVAALGRISATAVRAAAAGAVTGGASGGAGSATSGGSTPPGAAQLPGTGTSGHVVLMAGGWQAAALAGAALIIVAGIWTTLRTGSLPVMSGRYDRGPAPGPRSAGTGDSGAGVPAAPVPAAEAAIWESLSSGRDPTDEPAGPGGRRQ